MMRLDLARAQTKFHLNPQGPAVVSSGWAEVGSLPVAKRGSFIHVQFQWQMVVVLLVFSNTWDDSTNYKEKTENNYLQLILIKSKSAREKKKLNWNFTGYLCVNLFMWLLVYLLLIRLSGSWLGLFFLDRYKNALFSLMFGLKGPHEKCRIPVQQ